jgi:hypothetical protein
MNSLLQFTKSLWAGGDLVLNTNAAPGNVEVAEAMSELRTLELDYRQGLPDLVPQFHVPSAEWALTSLYRACQFLVYRELPEELMQVELGRVCPASASQDVCYSVDLSFRFLPELIRLARAGGGSPLLSETLQQWASTWPLSSVGVAGVAGGATDGFRDSPGLMMLYVDRILSCNDHSRLSDEHTSNAVRTALGGFPELSAVLYRSLLPVESSHSEVVKAATLQ